MAATIQEPWMTVNTLDCAPPDDYALWRGIKHGNTDACSRRLCNLECKHCVKAEKKEYNIDIWLTQNEDWSEVQRSDPILAKTIAVKEEDKRPTKKLISAEGPLTKAYWTQCGSLNLINGCLCRHWQDRIQPSSSAFLQNERSLKRVH